ncbi:DNA alkylation repair protein [Vagococcus coleopterorum]|uniref:DNA alkylation repair protein n=1 Tax=Vagococcus coleopterorum TaxID=2714946 RepID=A0A6G8AKZ2_9ENTE|nr:DNA alkylation repair protein [Vagococcus coleopterorum]QIL45657.1 DNA alkylation repair protein [Vagococcus coleopterorum]
MLETAMKELEALGTAQTKKTLMNHGAREPLFGVRIGDMKKELVKKYRGNNDLAIQLIKTGNSDAQYLAGLIMNPQDLTIETIRELVPFFTWQAQSEAVLACVAADSPHGQTLAEEWLASSDERLLQTGLVTLSKCASVLEDDQLNQELFKEVTQEMMTRFPSASDSLQYAINNYLISLGSFTHVFHEGAKDLLTQIADVKITAQCSVPDGLAKLAKVEERGSVGKKRKKAMC